jgi:hypothetical protein
LRQELIQAAECTSAATRFPDSSAPCIHGINTTVKVNGSTRLQNVPQGELPGGSAGAVTHWSKGRFDDLSVVSHPLR